MLSQYTWWDFFKVVGTGLVIYYAYVAWAYYREDIRDWFSNRGQPQEPASLGSSEPDDDDDDSRLYSTSNYTAANQSAGTPTAAEKADVVDEPDDELVHESIPEPEMAKADPNDSQAIVAEEVIPGENDELVFEMTIHIEPIKPTERSLAAAVRAAQGLQVDEQGRLLATDNAGNDSKELADTINEQKGFGSVLSGVNFNR